MKSCYLGPGFYYQDLPWADVLAIRVSFPSLLVLAVFVEPMTSVSMRALDFPNKYSRVPTKPLHHSLDPVDNHPSRSTTTMARVRLVGERESVVRI